MSNRWNFKIGQRYRSKAGVVYEIVGPARYIDGSTSWQSHADARLVLPDGSLSAKQHMLSSYDANNYWSKVR